MAPLRAERHSVSSLQTRVPREPHVCGSDGFIFISVAHLSCFPQISNAVDREIKLEMWNATCVSFCNLS